jgi:medium-chain acyl-CoA synthetase
MGVILCPCTTLLVDKDIEYRLNVSSAKVFVGDEVAVGKVLKVRDRCKTLQHVIQINSSYLSKASSNAVPSHVIDFNTSVDTVPAETTFATPSSLKPSSPALSFFTSGTTGNPKLVLHNQVSYPLAHALTGTHWLRLRPPPQQSLYWNLSEQGWAKAAWSFFSAWNCGAALFIHDDRQPFSARRTLQVLHTYPITTLCAPPTVWRQLVLDENRALIESGSLRPKALKHATGAGEPLNESVIRRWASIKGNNNMQICDGYGQTETILVCANQEGLPLRHGSMGKPLPNVPLTIIDNDGNDAAVDVEGDIAIAVPPLSGESKQFIGLFEGYVDMSTGQLDRKLRSFANTNNNGTEQSKSYYLTGDRARRDKDGYFWFVGRADDVINSAGYRIGPFEVESTLKLHDAVVESAVVACPDPHRDEVVKAFVVLTSAAAQKLRNGDGEDAESKLVNELQAFCKENAAPYKYPRKIEFVDAQFLPKTISGKIRRGELKKLERERYAKEVKKAKL